MKSLDTTQRFLRPEGVDRTRRNHRQIRTQKALVAAANLVLLTLLVGGGVWLYHRTQQDIRFAVKQVQMLGAKQTPGATLEGISATRANRPIELPNDYDQVRVHLDRAIPA